MDSKHSTRKSARRGHGQPAGLKAAEQRTRMIFDITQTRIETFNRNNGGGVSVRKLANGYTLIRDDTGESVARLRFQNEVGQYAVLRRSDGGERWERVGVAGLILPLDEALEFIAEDPLNCFWG